MRKKRKRRKRIGISLLLLLIGILPLAQAGKKTAEPESYALVSGGLSRSRLRAPQCDGDSHAQSFTRVVTDED
jgi:hypothetical protein